MSLLPGKGLCPLDYAPMSALGVAYQMFTSQSDNISCVYIIMVSFHCGPVGGLPAHV